MSELKNNSSKGTFEKGGLPALLLRWHAERTTGRIRLVCPGVHTFDLLGGRPALVDGSPQDFAAVLDGWMSAGEAASLLEEARRQGRPPGEILVREGRVDDALRSELEEEVTIRRLLSLCRSAGSWHLDDLPETPSARWPVPMLAALWRLEDPEIPVRRTDWDEAWVVPCAGFAEAWRRVDPRDQQPGIRLLLEGRAQVQEVLTAAGPGWGARLALLVETGVIALSPDCPDAAHRSRALTRSDLDSLRAALAWHHTVTTDADPWIVLGISPGADRAAVESAAFEAASRFHPHHLPPGLGPVDREAARVVHQRILAARTALTGTGGYVPRALPPAEIAWDDHAVLLADRAWGHIQAGRPQAAEEILAVARDLEGDDPDVLALLGLARHRMDPARGEAELRKALARDPDHTSALAWLAGICAENGRWSEARPFLKRLFRLDPDHAEGRGVAARDPGEG